MKEKAIMIGPYINWLGSQYIDFYKIAKALSDTFRVICIDYPGRGGSDYFEEKDHYM